MSRIFRYTFREVLTPSLLGLMIYTFVLLMNAIFNVAEFAIKRNLPTAAVFKLLALSLPQFLTLTVPMSVLLGILIGIGRQSADSEIIALRSCGFSYWKLFLPVLTLGLLGWLFCSVLILVLEPKADFTRHRLATKLLLRSDLRKELKPRVVYEEIPGMLLYAEKVYRGGSSLEHVLLYQSDPAGRDLVTSARRGHLDYESGTGRMKLFLEDGLTHRSDPLKPDDYQVYGADRQMVLREPDAGFKLRARLLKEPQQKSYREQSLAELQKSWDDADKISHLPTRHRIRNAIDVVYQERFAMPLACLVFAIVGFPLGIFNRRGGKSSGIALSLGVVLVYWLILTTGEQLATEGKLSPIAALWTGNLLFTVLGVLYIRRRERKESESSAGSQWLAAIPGGVVRLKANLVERWRVHRKTKLAPSAPLPVETIESRRRHSGGPAFSTMLDRYVLRSYLRFLLITGISIYTIFLVVDFREMIDDVINSRVPGILVLQFFKYRTPWVVNQILPVACLVSTLLAFGVLSRFNEIVAMLAGGLSLYRISVPVVGMTALISVFSLALQGYIMPFTNQRANQIRDQIRGRPARSYSQPQRRWLVGRDGLVYSFKTYQRTGTPFLPLGGEGVFQGFSVTKLDPETFGIRQRIYAREATWKEGVWTLKDGWERKFGAQGQVASFEEFTDRQLPLSEEPSHFLGDARTPDQMSYSQLREFISDLRRRGYSVQELLVDLHEKVALPFVSLVMVILGLPFAFRAGKKGSLYGIGLSIGLVVAYYATFAVLSALGQIGFLPPLLAAWAPNILWMGTGAYLMITVVRT